MNIHNYCAKGIYIPSDVKPKIGNHIVGFIRNPQCQNNVDQHIRGIPKFKLISTSKVVEISCGTVRTESGSIYHTHPIPREV